MAFAGISSEGVRVLLRDKDTGPYGHLYHAVMVQLLDEARGGWLTNRISQAANDGHVIARLDVTYIREVTGEQRELTIRTEVERIGNSSLTLFETVLDAEGDAVATCRAVLVLWDPTTRRPRPLSTHERETAGMFVRST